MIEVEIHNFQSVEHVVIQIDGFTTLVGRSNIGKTAIVRAVKAALTGRAGNNFVRHSPTCARLAGAKKCKCHASVHVKAPGIDLLWEKGDAVNRYTYNGTVYDKVERGTPSFLSPLFSLLKVGDKPTLLQVADQFHPIFLLDTSGPAVADTLSDVARLDQINVASRLADKDLREARATLKVRRKDVQALARRVEAYDGLDDAVKPVDLLQEELRGLHSGQADVLRLEAYDVQVSARTRALRQYEGLELIEPLNFEPVEEARVRYDWVSQRLVRLRQFKRFFHGQPEVGEPPEARPVLDGLRQLDAAASFLRRYQDLETDVEAAREHLREWEQEEALVQAEIDALGHCPTCMKPLDKP